MTRYVYDAGALIAAERDSALMKRTHFEALKQRQLPLVPGPVITQAWRGGPRAARMRFLLDHCEVLCGLTEDLYFMAGRVAPKVRLPSKKRFDATDMLVAVAAKVHEASAIVTSDSIDICAYLDALNYKCRVFQVLARPTPRDIRPRFAGPFRVPTAPADPPA